MNIFIKYVFPIALILGALYLSVIEIIGYPRLIKLGYPIKNLRLRVLEAFRETSDSQELSPLDQKRSLYLEEVLEEIHDVKELEYLRSLVKRIEEKKSAGRDRPKDGRDISSQLH